jgi:hypothetical protein
MLRRVMLFKKHDATFNKPSARSKFLKLLQKGIWRVKTLARAVYLVAISVRPAAIRSRFRLHIK